MADNLQASPQSPALAWLAEKLRAARSAGDTVTIPYLGGVGTMMLGKSPEEVTEWSYGNAPMHVPAMTRVPQFKKDRAESLADTLFAAQAAAPVARMAPAAARELAPAAGAMALRAAEVGGMPVYGLGVIKPKGGNWLAGSVENALEPMRTYLPSAEMVREAGMNPDIPARHSAEAMNKWIDTKLAKYIKNEMGTPEDPIRALAERGVTHSEVSPLNTYDLKLLGQRRESVGFPAEGLGQSEAARAWEAAADEAMHNLPAGHRLEAEGLGSSVVDENPWLQKVPPETMTYGAYRRAIEGQTQFGHLLDELRNAVNPESGLPANLRWKYTDLDKVTVPQAVQRVHDINQWRAAQQAEANAMRANNAAAFLHKDYPEAPYKWVELKAPTDLPEGWKYMEKSGNYVTPEGKVTSRGPHEIALEDALKYEGETMGHCVGGYCPDVLEGRSRIFSLRNKKTGEPHVTVEVQPPAYDYPVSGEEFAMLPQETKDRYRAITAEWRSRNPDDPDVWKALAEAGIEPTPPIIKQIKGKANRAPKEEYLPYVQDFVRSGKWSDVGDLENTGLYDIMPEAVDRLRASGREVPRYITEEEMTQLHKDFPKGFAQGGLVDGAAEYSPLEVDYIINNIHGYAQGGVVTQQVKAPFNEFSMNYDINPVEIGHARGGSVESAHLPYDEAKISSLVNALREELHA